MLKDTNHFVEVEDESIKEKLENCLKDDIRKEALIQAVEAISSKTQFRLGNDGIVFNVKDN